MGESNKLKSSRLIEKVMGDREKNMKISF